MPCLIKKTSRCAADRRSKTTTFLSFTFNKTQRSYKKSCVFFGYFIGSVVKIVLYLHFLYTKDNRLRQIKKRNMNNGTNLFLTSLLITLTWNILLLFSFWHKIISCFKLKSQLPWEHLSPAKFYYHKIFETRSRWWPKHLHGWTSPLWPLYNWRYKDLSMSHDQKVMTLLPQMEKSPFDFYHRVVFTA